MSKIYTIDFSKIEGPVYTGRPRGEALRQKHKLDEVDESDTLVDVKIPESVYSISSSFFLGMFGDSVVHLGSRDSFYKKFRFQTSSLFLEVIDSCVGRALQEKQLFAEKNSRK